jgi:hypothetical protein
MDARLHGAVGPELRKEGARLSRADHHGEDRRHVVTIHGFGAHTGLGEEWADNDNAETAVEVRGRFGACPSR